MNGLISYKINCKLKNLYFFKLNKECSAQAPIIPVIEVNSSSMSVLMGSSVSITCYGYYMDTSDICWSFYSTSSPTKIIIYYSNNYVGVFSTFFNISLSAVSFTNISSTLTVYSVTDSSYTFECACNTITRPSCTAATKATSTIISFTSKTV